MNGMTLVMTGKKAQKPNEILHAMQIASIRNKCGNNKGHTSLCI